MFRVRLPLLLLALTVVPLLGQQQEPLPDPIVTDARLDGTDLVLEIQNQGPGTATQGAKLIARVTSRYQNKPVSFDQEVLVPNAVFELTEVRIPLLNFKADKPEDFGLIVTVKLDPDGKFKDANPQNNEYHHQLGNSTTEKRGDYRQSKELPDLVITGMTVDDLNLYVEFKNQGKGVTGGDFLFRVQNGTSKFEGNYFYRYVVPPPGHTGKTGGLNLNLIDLKAGDTATIEVTIDHEGRVRETDRTNNTFKKKITLPKP